MSVVKALDDAFFLKCSTSDSIPLEEVVKAFDSLGLSSEIRVLYRHIAEVVCNIYEHAPSEACEKVDWSLSVHWDFNSLVVTIKDHGQGIYKSIAPQLDKTVSPLESLNLAVNRHSSQCEPVRSYRGLGLKGIAKAVVSGTLDSFHIESDGYLLSYLHKAHSVKKIHKTSGTKVQLILRSDGGAK